jgi:Fe2+ or Zn2+ uptake regulation protein
MTALALTPADIRGTENRAAGVRAFLRANGPSTVNEICLGIGITDSYTRSAVRSSVRAMVQNGILARHGDSNPARYSVLREPEPRSAEPARARRAETFRIKAANLYKNTEAAYLAWRQETANDPAPVSQRIRDIIKRHGIATAEQIYAGLGIDPTVGRARVYSIIHWQVRDKLIERIPGKPLRYRWLRDGDPHNRPKRPPTAKAKARAEALQQRKFNHQQRLAERRAARDERIAQHKREAQERRETRQRDAFARAQLKAQRQQPYIAKLAAGAAAKAAAKPSQTAVVVEPESIDQWTARTGKTPEVLPHRFDDPITTYPRRRPIYNPKGHTA